MVLGGALNPWPSELRQGCVSDRDSSWIKASAQDVIKNNPDLNGIFDLYWAWSFTSLNIPVHRFALTREHDQADFHECHISCINNQHINQFISRWINQIGNHKLKWKQTNMAMKKNKKTHTDYKYWYNVITCRRGFCKKFPHVYI